MKPALFICPRTYWQKHGAAYEEHRPPDELVGDAVRRYLQARRRIAPLDTAGPVKRKSRSELFAPLRGLDIDLSRNPSTGRPVNL